MKKLLKRIIKRILGLNTESKLEILKKGGLRVGKNFNMLEECIIDESHYWHIKIGDDVTLAPRVQIIAHDASTKLHLNYTKIKNINIGDRVFIGAGSIILPGVNIGNNVIVGAGSVVNRDIPDNSVFAGNPAHFICTHSDYLAKIKSKIKTGNTFGEEYTLRSAIDNDKKIIMREVIDKEGIGFVI
jgi:maltose O-acetyltransferase